MTDLGAGSAIDAIARAESYLGSNVNTAMMLQQLSLTFETR
jgi:hypothetical protein